MTQLVLVCRRRIDAGRTNAAAQTCRTLGMAGKRNGIIKSAKSPKNKRRVQAAKKMAKQANSGLAGCSGLGTPKAKRPF